VAGAVNPQAAAERRYRQHINFINLGHGGLMPTRSAKKKKRIKLLIAIIFAEAGFILGVTGLGHIIFGHGGAVAVDFSAVLSISEAFMFFNGTVTRGKPEYYRDAYVYLVAYAPGVSLPDAVVRSLVFGAAERPVYVLPIPRTSGAIVPHDFADVLPDNAKNPIILLTYPPDKLNTVLSWLQGIKNLPQSNYIRIELRDGRPVNVVAVA